MSDSLWVVIYPDDDDDRLIWVGNGMAHRERKYAELAVFDYPNAKIARVVPDG